MNYTEILGGYGLAGVVIFVLGGAVLFLYRELKAERTRVDTIMDLRLADAKETNNKLIDPLNELTRVNKQIYDAVVRNSGV